jgi:methionyl-tRNA formyltransferase
MPSAGGRSGIGGCPDSSSEWSMKVLFFGIYGLGYHALSALLGRRIRVVGVVTKPGSEEGQKDLLGLIRATGLPLRLPDSPAAPGLSGWIGTLRPDLIAVAGYPHRIPLKLLRLPPRGCLNTHLSLLPKYRGPCPWKWARARGERTSGVTVHSMAERFDQGPILAQREFAIADEETGGSLFHHLSILGADMLAQALVDLQAGNASYTVQDERAATYQGAPTDRETHIRWDLGSREILNQVRGFSPRPGAWTSYHGKKVRIRNASMRDATPPIRAGTILGLTKEGLRVATGDGVLELHEIVSEGNPLEDSTWEMESVFQVGSTFDEGTPGVIPWNSPIGVTEFRVPQELTSRPRLPDPTDAAK